MLVFMFKIDFNMTPCHGNEFYHHNTSHLHWVETLKNAKIARKVDSSILSLFQTNINTKEVGAFNISKMSKKTR